MATSEMFHDFVMEQVSRAGEYSSVKMMGEYCIKRGGKTVALLCDNQLLIKPTPSVLQMLPDAVRMYPYEGSKTLMSVMDDIENTELLSRVLSAAYEELPEPGPKKKRTGRRNGS